MKEPVRIFNEHRPRLFGLAYRMLGNKADAEDVLQDAYLRWESDDTSRLRSPGAWLTTVVSRLSIDRLRHLQVERESYFGPWLPEPLSECDPEGPETAAELADDISVAFLIVLENLTPRERAAFLLRDVLNEDYATIACTLNCSTASCRQILHRARKRVSARQPRNTIDSAAQISVLNRFKEALAKGDREDLLAVLADEAVLISDGGGRIRSSIRPLHGADRIAWLWYAVSQRLPDAFESRITLVNGRPGLVQIWNGRIHSVADIETDGRLIYGHYTILNPDKLGSFQEFSRLRDLTKS